MNCAECGIPVEGFFEHPDGIACVPCGREAFSKARNAGTLGYGLTIPESAWPSLEVRS